MTVDRLLTLSPEYHDPGQDLGRYVVRSLIGEGSMAQVYRAYDPLAERDVALKVLRIDTRSLHGKGGNVRFFREAEAAGRLSHPHIVTIYDVTDDYIVMEYLDGVTLEYLLSWRAPLALHEAMAILHPLADALDYAHARGTIHRDVKPGNILVLPDGGPKLTDFGVAHLESASITSPGEFLGSPSYMSPEQIDGKAVSARSDVFSLAAVVYEMLTGERAFLGPSVPAALHAVLHGTPAPPTELRPELPPHCDAVLARALSKAPEDRYASAGALAAALDRAGYERALERIARGDSGVSISHPFASRPAVRAESEEDATFSVDARGAVETRDLGLVPRLDEPARVRPPRRGLLRWAAALVGGTAIAIFVSLALDPLGVGGQPPPIVAPTLVVETQPAGASVWLDGQALGTSPIVGVPLAAGTHELNLDRAGFAPVRLRFESGSAASFRLTLRPRSEIDARPFGATLAVARPGQQIESVERERMAIPVRAWLRSPHVVLPPRRVAGEAPSYPAAAAAAQLQGTVTAELTVTATGEPADIVIAESAGDILDQAVLDAIQTWRFDPAFRNGAAVAVRWQVRQRFERH